jgi:hypothetical protein
MYSFVVPLSLLCGYIFFCGKGVIIQTLRSPPAPLKKGGEFIQTPPFEGGFRGFFQPEMPSREV